MLHTTRISPLHHIPNSASLRSLQTPKRTDSQSTIQTNKTLLDELNLQEIGQSMPHIDLDSVSSSYQNLSEITTLVGN
jgi:hypothetical protein